MTSFENETILPPNGTGSSKKGMLRLALIGVPVVAVALGGSYLAYAKYDVFKSAKTIYLQSELTEMIRAKASLTELLDKYNKEVTPLLDKPTHSVVDLSDLTIDLTEQNKQTKGLLDVLKKSKLTADIQEDLAGQKQVYQFNWQVGSDPLLGVDMAMDAEKLAVRIPVLYSKYGYVNMKDLEQFRKEYSDSIPKKVLTYKDLANAVSIKQEELQNVLQPYALLYASNIEENQVQIKKDSLMQEENASIKSRELTVTFTENDMKRLVNSFADRLAADTALQDILYTRSSNVTKLMKDAGYETKEWSKDDFAKWWKQFTDDLKKSGDNGAFSEGATMTVYINGKHEILERKLVYHTKSNGNSNEVLVKAANWSDNEFKQRTLFSIQAKKGDNENNELKLVHSSNLSDAGGKGKVVFNLKETGGKQDGTGAALDLDYDVTQSASKDTGKYTFKVTGNGDAAGTVEGTVSAAVNKSEKQREADYDVRLSFKDMKAQNELKALGFKLHSKQELGVEVKLPEFTKENAIDLANLSERDQMQLYQEVMMGVQKFMDKNKDLLLSLGLPYGNSYGSPYGRTSGMQQPQQANPMSGLSLDELDPDTLAESLESMTPQEQEALLKALQQMEAQGKMKR
ncbi:DUF6583 family protein [Paenibacillus rigui]|uniref:Uncharacterized protein n=1 Tax=Paenibacillus rigui TaxID=554312 RepID=A0A229ULR1_9BACL|nr:DUF6583 family protein [Paenibacillus rigui]OXM84312.1 hypothetical protein CF651_21245 [Paenibacillus rigui]